MKKRLAILISVLLLSISCFASITLITGAGSSSGSGDMLGANNLSDVSSAATSATNLGLGSGNNVTFATVNATVGIFGNVSSNLMGRTFDLASTPTNNDIIYYDSSAGSFKTKQTSIFQVGSGQILYMWSDASDVATCNKLELVPTISGTSFTLTANAAGLTGNAKNNLGPTGGFGVITIPAGEWMFTDYVFIDATTGISQLVYEVWVRTAGGVETKLFETSGSEINDTAAVWLEDNSSQLAFTINATDRLLLKRRLLTTSPTTRTLTIATGGANSGHIHTPLGAEHDSLSNIKGTGYYHITAGEGTVVTALAAGNVSLNGTLTANAIVLGGVRNTAWPAGGSGTVTQSVQFAINGAITAVSTTNLLRDYARTSYVNTVGSGTLKSFAVFPLKLDTGATQPSLNMLVNGTQVATIKPTTVATWNITTVFTSSVLNHNSSVEFGTGAEGSNDDSLDYTFRFTFTQP